MSTASPSPPTSADATAKQPALPKLASIKLPPLAPSRSAETQTGGPPPQNPDHVRTSTSESTTFDGSATLVKDKDRVALPPPGNVTSTRSNALAHPAHALVSSSAPPKTRQRSMAMAPPPAPSPAPSIPLPPPLSRSASEPILAKAPQPSDPAGITPTVAVDPDLALAPASKPTVKVVAAVLRDFVSETKTAFGGIRGEIKEEFEHIRAMLASHITESLTQQKSLASQLQDFEASQTDVIGGVEDLREYVKDLARKVIDIESRLDAFGDVKTSLARLERLREEDNQRRATTSPPHTPSYAQESVSATPQTGYTDDHRSKSFHPRDFDDGEGYRPQKKHQSGRRFPNISYRPPASLPPPASTSTGKLPPPASRDYRTHFTFGPVEWVNMRDDFPVFMREHHACKAIWARVKAEVNTTHLPQVARVTVDRPEDAEAIVAAWNREPLLGYENVKAELQGKGRGQGKKY